MAAVVWSKVQTSHGRASGRTSTSPCIFPSVDFGLIPASPLQVLGRHLRELLQTFQGDLGTAASYCQVFEGLFALQSTQGDQGRSRPTVLELTPEGKSLFVEWVNRHHAEMAEPNFPDHLRGAWSKLEGYCARFALILQRCRHAAREACLDGIDAVSVSGAVAIADYFKGQTRKVYARLRATEDDEKVAKLVAWIRRNGGSATVREVVSGKVAGCKKASEAKALFLEMEERGYGSIEEVTPPQGGRKSVLFKLGPQSATGS